MLIPHILPTLEVSPSPGPAMDAFLTSVKDTPYGSSLRDIATHLRDRKKADDDMIRHLKDAMMVEYTNQSEQHEKLAGVFVDGIQDGLDGLAA